MVAPPNIDKLRVAALVQMLEADRRLAIKERNPSASLAATVRLAELLLDQLAEAAEQHPQITTIKTVFLHQVICPVCREKGVVTDSAPPPEPASAPHIRAASGWYDEPEETEPEPAPLVELRPEPTIAVPKLPTET